MYTYLLYCKNLYLLLVCIVSVALNNLSCTKGLHLFNDKISNLKQYVIGEQNINSFSFRYFGSLITKFYLPCTWAFDICLPP